MPATNTKLENLPPVADASLTGSETVYSDTGTLDVQLTLDQVAAFTATKPVAVNDNVFTLKDNGDETRRAQFDASGIASGQTRTFAFPDADAMLVGLDTTQTLTNKTLTAPAIATIKNTGTLTMPTSTDTLVGRDTTDTLTNKTLGNSNTITVRDDRFTLQDDGDATKQLKHDLSGIATGNTRTATWPNANITVVGTAATQTLTNKTLTSPTINGGTASHSVPDTSTPLTSTSTDAGAVTFTALDVYRNSASPTANDFLGKIQFNGNDSLGNKTAFAEIGSAIDAPTDGAEDGRLIFRASKSGSLVDLLTVSGGSPIVVPTGYRSVSAAIADDATATLTPAGAASGIMAVGINNATPSAARPFGQIAFRCLNATVAPVAVGWNDPSNVLYGTGVPTGTTGTDGKLTFYCNGDGNVYVENRLGASLNFRFTFIAT